MLRVLLDLQTLQSNSRHRGIGNYSRGLADALLRHDDIEWHVLLSDAMPETLPEAMRWVRARVERERVHVFHGLAPTRGTDPAATARAQTAEVLYAGFVDALDVDLVHVASPFEGWSDDTVLDIHPGRATACAATVYDLIPFEEPESFLPTPELASWYGRRLERLRRVESVLAISDHTAEVARARLGLEADRVTAIGADVDPLFAPRQLSDVASRALTARYRITRPFLIHVGIPEPRKNIARLIEAFAHLPEDLRAAHQIVLATKITDAQRQDLLGLAQGLGLAPDALVLPGFVPDPDLADLYALARVAVMPSLNEGFGLPLLEAMRCHCPVLGSNTTSIPEVIGRDNLTFDPLQPAEIADRLGRMLSDPGFRADAVAHARKQQARFSWTTSAQRACAAFRQAVERRSASAPRSTRVPDLIALTPGRYILPLLPVHADEPSTVSLYPSDPAALNVMLNASGPSLVIDLREGNDGDDRDRSQAEAPMHPHHVATVTAAGATSTQWQLAWQSWARSRVEAPDPQTCENLAEVLDRVAGHHPLLQAAIPIDRLNALGDKTALPDEERVARALADNHAPRQPQPRLLVDITELSQRDARSGIQRVVRNILAALFAEPDGFEIVPIRRDGASYRYARTFMKRFLGTAAVGADTPLDFRTSDTFLGLDFDASITPEAVAVLRRQHLRGVRFVHVLYDTLPLHRPDWWGPEMYKVYSDWLHGLAEISDGIACISQAVADDVKQVLVERRFLKGRSPAVGAFHLGADLDAAQPAASADTDLALQAPGLFEPGTPVFVTVGTLEPRKGHAQLLDAAEILWGRGNPVVFAIVGKRGWLVDDLIERITTHPELDRRLRWFEAVDDAVLAQVYRAGTAALLPSEGEGFGLPLVEAAHAGLPILARDLPVFREIGGAHATYFNGFDGQSLAVTIEAWLAAHAKGETPDSAGIRPLTWSESARQLMNVVRSVAHQP